MAVIDTRMTATALATARSHVENVAALGTTVTLVKAATKDELGGITSESTQDLTAFPIRFSPYDRNIERRISWAEDTDILFYIAKKQIDDLSLTVNYLKKNYEKVRYDGRMLDIRYIEPYSQFANDFLYVIIGVKA